MQQDFLSLSDHMKLSYLNVTHDAKKSITNDWRLRNIQAPATQVPMQRHFLFTCVIPLAERYQLPQEVQILTHSPFPPQ